MYTYTCITCIYMKTRYQSYLNPIFIHIHYTSKATNCIDLVFQHFDNTLFIIKYSILKTVNAVGNRHTINIVADHTK